MRADPADTPPPLHALCRQAEARAADWGPTRHEKTTRRVPALKLALVGGLSLLALAVVAAQFRSAPQSVPASVPSVLPPPTTAAAPLTLPTLAASPAGPVHWEGEDLVINFDAVPLPQAVAWLAQATQTTVTGTALLPPAALVTLHLRSSDRMGVWQRLLLHHVAFGTSCGWSACQLWITAPAAAAAAPAAQGTDAGPAPVPDATPNEESVSQPGGSC